MANICCSPVYDLLDVAPPVGLLDDIDHIVHRGYMYTCGVSMPGS